jgi:transcriptional regulator with XRE-family HTH domain
MIAAEWEQIVVALGVNIRELRALIGWSQQQLADRAITSQGTISRLESGKYGDMPFHSVVVVLRTLGTAVTELDLTVSPLLRSLLTFVESITGTVELVEPHPDLMRIVRTFNRMSARQRAAFMRFIGSAAELVVLTDHQEVA